MKVEIEAGGRSVTIECSDANVTYEGVADKALQVWKETAGVDTLGPAYGFASMERSGQ